MDDNGERFVSGLFFFPPKDSVIPPFGDGVSPSFSGLFPDSLLLLLFFSALLRLLVSCFVLLSPGLAHIFYT